MVSTRRIAHARVPQVTYQMLFPIRLMSSMVGPPNAKGDALVPSGSAGRAGETALAKIPARKVRREVLIGVPFGEVGDT